MLFGLLFNVFPTGELLKPKSAHFNSVPPTCAEIKCCHSSEQNGPACNDRHQQTPSDSAARPSCLALHKAGHIHLNSCHLVALVDTTHSIYHQIAIKFPAPIIESSKVYFKTILRNNLFLSEYVIVFHNSIPYLISCRGCARLQQLWV